MGIQAGGNAGRLNIEVVAEIARLQQDMDRMKRVVNAASGDIAKSARAANDNLASIGKGAGAGVQAFGRDVAALKAQLDPAWAAQQRFNEQQQLGMVALKAGAIDRQQFITHMRQINGELKGLSPVQDKVTNSARQQRQGFQQLGFQLGDFSTQVSSGTSITQAFAQQIGQTAQALQLMGGGAGALGKVAGFLSGGWGIALTVALPLMAAFISKLFETKDAAKEMKAGVEDAATSIQKMFAEMGRSSAIGENATKAVSELLTAQATLAALRARLQRVIDSPNKSQIALITQLKLYIPVLEQEVRKREANVEAIRTASEVMKLQATQVEKNRAADEAATKALQEKTAATRQYGREIGLADAKAIAARAGMRVTSGLRSREEQQWLYDNKRTPQNPVARPGTSAHERGGALDIAYGAGVTEASIKKAYADAGVRLIKILRETGHFHIEWSTTGADKAMRDLTKLADTARKEAQDTAEEFAAIMIRLGIAGQAATDARMETMSAGFDKDFADFKKGVGISDEDAQRLNDVYEGIQKIRDLTPELRLGEVFGEFGNALEQVKSTIDEMTEAQDRYNDALSTAQQMQAGKARDEAIAAAKTAHGKEQLRNTIGLIGATKRLFAQESAAYQALEAMEKALAAVELVRTAIYVAKGAAKMFASLGPFAFPVVAAMIGVMASLGFKGGGGSMAAPPSAKELQEAAGTGSVLGDPSAKSNSISNSLELVAENTNKDLEYSNKMLMALRSIDTSIAKLAGTVAKQITVSGSMFDTSGANLGSSGSGGFLGMFSSSTTRELWDLGLDLTSSTVADIIANGIAGQTYQIVQQIKKKSGFFGIGGGTKTTYETSYGQIDPGITSAIGDVLESLRQGLLSASDVIGLQGAQAIIDGFQISLGRISFKDMTGQEIEDQLNAIFSKVGDDLAGAILPGLKEMQLIGEGLFETFMRIAREYQVVEISLKSIGLTFGAVGVSSVAARDNLVQLFGSLDDFVSATDFYRDNFLTDAEKIAPIMGAVADEMARLGLSSVDTIDEFKGVINGLDLTTQAGRDLFAAMMNVAPAFSAVEKYQDKLAKEWEDRAKSLTDYRDSLMGSSGATSYAAIAAQYRTLADAAGTGDASALDGLKSASDKFLEVAKANAVSELDYARARAEVLNNLDTGIDAANSQADLARRTTAAVESMATEVAATTQLTAQLTASVAQLNRKIDAATAEDGALRVTNDDDTPLTIETLSA